MIRLLRRTAIGVLFAAAVVFLDVITAGTTMLIVALVAVVLGAAVAAGLWRLERVTPLRVIALPYSWVGLVVASAVPAIWAAGAANEGCPGAETGMSRALAALALFAIGAVGLSFPAFGTRFILGRDGLRFWERAGFTVLGLVWLLVWAYLWFVVWRIELGCVD